MELKDIVEALLFAAPEPISAKEVTRCIRSKLEDETEAEEIEDAENVDETDEAEKDGDADGSTLAKTKPREVEAAIRELNLDYEQTGRAFRIIEGPTGWRMASNPDFADWIRELFPGNKPAKLSAPALETLAIVAYRQPITKADIEAVRGVSVDGVMNKIIDRGLIKIVGRAELPGRPLLYGTTEMFMEHFGIKKLDDLPNAAELRTVPLPSAEDGEQQPQEAQGNLDFSPANAENLENAENPADSPPKPATEPSETDDG